MKTHGPRGWSAVYRTDRQQWVIKYLTPLGETLYHYVPRELRVRARGDAEKYAAAWFSEQQVKWKTTQVVSKKRRAEGKSTAEVVRLWIAMRRTQVPEFFAASTVKANNDHLNTHVLPHFGDKPFGAVVTDYPALLTWFRQLRKKLSASRARNVFSTFRMLVDDVRPNGWANVLENPFRNEALVRELPPLPTSKERGVIWLPLDWAQALISHPTVPLGRRVRYVLAFTSGEADGEISGKCWKHLLLDAPVAVNQVVQAFQVVRPEGSEAPGKTKNRYRVRDIPLHESAIQALHEWRDDVQGVSVLLCRKPLPDDPVFPDAEGSFCRPRSAFLLRQDLRKCGLPDHINGKPVTFHATRRSFTTWLKRAKVDPAIRKRIIGHVRMDVEDEHYTGEDLPEMANAIGRIPLRWTSGVPFLPPPPRAGVLYEIDGKSLLLAEWARERKIPKATLHYRVITRGLSLQDALRLGSRR